MPLIHWDPDHPECFDENHNRIVAVSDKYDVESIAGATYNVDKQSKPEATTGQSAWSGLFECSTSRIIPISLFVEKDRVVDDKVGDANNMQLTDIVD